MKRSGAKWTMGLHPFDDPIAIFPLRDCPITDERVVTTWREILLAAEHLPNATELRGTVRVAGSDIVVLVKGGSAWPAAETEPDAWPIDRVDPIPNKQGSPGIFADAQFGGHRHHQRSE